MVLIITIIKVDHFSELNLNKLLLSKKRFLIPCIYKTLVNIYNIPRIFGLDSAWALLYGGGGCHVLEDCQTQVGSLQDLLSP